MSDREFLKKGLDELKSLRDELEQAIKGASDEAREGWKRLQPRLKQAEQTASDKASDLARDLNTSAGEFITDVRGKLQQLRDRIAQERAGSEQSDEASPPK